MHLHQSATQSQHATLQVCVDTPDAVPAAEDEIERVANLVGATPLTASGGKLETYIRRHCPVVLRNLVEAGILSAEPQTESYND